MRILATATFLVLAAFTVQSATLTVPGDYSTIQAAINAAYSDDEVLVAPGIYSGAGNRNITFLGKGITLRSELGPTQTTIDCQGLGKAFVLTDNFGENPTIEGFTIKNGDGGHQGGAIECFLFSPTIRRCIFLDNTADYGGALYCNGGTAKSGQLVISEPLIEQCTFIGNSARGGSVYYSNYDANPSFVSCLIVENSASSGAPIWANDGGGPLTLSCCDIYANHPGDWIGGIASQGSLNDNFSLDPEFCDALTGNYSVRPLSPCAATNSPCGSLVGAEGPEHCYIELPTVGHLLLNGGTTFRTSTDPPTFSWTFYDDPSSTQSAYEVEIGTDADWTTAEMWATGPVNTSDEFALYAGSPLAEYETYYVRLRVSNASQWGSWFESTFSTYFYLRVPQDYATIQAAIDAAYSGDEVLVAPGIYSGAGNRDITFLGKGITLRSEIGPTQTTIDCQGLGKAFILTDNSGENPTIEGFTIKNGDGGHQGGAIECFLFSPTIRRCIFLDNSADYGGALYCNGGMTKSGQLVISEPLIEQCTFIGNSARSGSVYYSNHDANATFVACLMVDNSSSSGAPVRVGDAGDDLILSCCDIYSNHPGDWIGGIASQGSLNDNFSLDPEFRDALAGNYSVQPSSPCAATNSPCGSLVGASEIGMCGGELPLLSYLSLGAGEFTHVIDNTPTISWEYYDDPTSIQAGYEIEVGTDADWAVAEMWTTGQIFSSDESAVYNGSPLLDGEAYHIRVRGSNGSDWGGWCSTLFRMNSIPEAPVPVSPTGGATVHKGNVVLTTDNAAESDGDALTYNFEMYSDAGLTTLVAEFTNIPEQSSQTSVGPVEGLYHGTYYWWRVRASDEYEFTSWSAAQMFVTAVAVIHRVPQDFATIQAAIDFANGDDVILVSPGNYLEHINLGSRNIDLVSTDGYEATFISAVNSGQHVVEFPANRGNTSTIEGFTIRDAYRANAVVIGEGNSPTIRFCHMTNNAGLDGAGIMCLGDDVLIYGCRFTNNRCNEVKYDEGAGIFITGNNVTVDSCLFAHNNSNSGSAGAIYTRFSDGVVISNNLAYDNSSLGQGTGFMYAYSASNISIINNTIVGNQTNLRGAGISLINDNGVDIRNNIIAFNEGGYGLWVQNCAGVVAEYNDVYGNPMGNYSGIGAGLGSISEDPLFLGMEADNYSIPPHSPCVDAGDPDPTYNDTDGTRNDLGALWEPLDVPLVYDLLIVDEDLSRVVSHTPEFAWAYFDYPESYQYAYEIEVGTDPSWTIAEMWASGQITSADNVGLYSGAPLLDGVTYLARVRVNNGSQWGEWRGMAFHMNGLAPLPTLISPNDGETVHFRDAILTADNAVDPEGDPVLYNFEVYADAGLTIPSFSLSDFVQATGPVSVGPIQGIDADEEYWWRLRSYDGYEYSDWTTSQSFLTVGYLVRRVPSEYPSIRDAINASYSTDSILVADGVYTGADNKGLGFSGKQLVVTSENGPKFTVIDCQDNDRAFLISQGETVESVIKGFTIRNGSHYAGGAIRIQDASVTVIDCIMENNTATHGGAVYINSPPMDPVFINCQFLGNDALGDHKDLADGRGGAVYAQYGGFLGRFNDCLFAYNMADDGGALFCGDGVGLVLTSCTMAANFASNEGAAVFPAEDRQVYLDRCLIAFNEGGSVVNCTNSWDYIICTNIYGNEGGDWIECIADNATQHDNRSLDPYFCGFHSGAGDFRLRPQSPCMPENNSCGQQIGAMGVGSECTDYLCGDADGDDLISWSDVRYLRNAYFMVGPLPLPSAAGDPNCDGMIAIDDIIYLVDFIRGVGAAPCCFYDESLVAGFIPKTWPPEIRKNDPPIDKNDDLSERPAK